MARPREFDIDEALEAAMAAFWEHGFEATSLVDLTDATGLHKGSIYKAFGSKHELFADALGRYLDNVYEVMREALQGERTPREGVQCWLRVVLRLCNDQASRRGCFAVNSVVELGPHSESTAERLRAHFAAVEKLLAGTIKRGQARGQFRRDRSAAELAAALFVNAAGMLATSKIPHSGRRLERLASFAAETLT